MGNIDAKNAITSLLIARKQDVEALAAAQAILEDGFQSDQTAIDEAIAEGIANQLPAAIAAQTELLEGQLSQAISDKNAVQAALDCANVALEEAGLPTVAVGE